MIDIRVKHSGVVPRTYRQEEVRGTLFAAGDADFPFQIRRVYVISDVPSAALRGDHAHRETDQVMFVVRGNLTLHLDDGEAKQSLKLTSKDEGVRLAPLLWHAMSDFSEDCIALVVADKPYDEADYIHDYEEFKKHADSL